MEPDQPTNLDEPISDEPIQPPEAIPTIIPIPLSLLGGFMGIGPTTETLEQRVINQSFHDQPAIQKVASKDFINSLSIQKVTNDMVSNDICCGICLEPLQEGDEVVELPCIDKHYFHIKREGCDGIYPWLKNNATCPMCRHEFPSQEKRVEPPRELMPPPPITPQSLLGMVNQIIDDENERMLQEALLNSTLPNQ